LDNIPIQKYIILVNLSFKAVWKRVLKIKQALTTKIKNKKINASQIDYEYFFSLENLLQQIESLKKTFSDKNWEKRTDVELIRRKTLVIFKNLHNLILSIVRNDHDSVRDISNSILSYDQLSFDIDNKLIS